MELTKSELIAAFNEVLKDMPAPKHELVWFTCSIDVVKTFDRLMREEVDRMFNKEIK